MSKLVTFKEDPDHAALILTKEELYIIGLLAGTADITHKNDIVDMIAKLYYQCNGGLRPDSTYLVTTNNHIRSIDDKGNRIKNPIVFNMNFADIKNTIQKWWDELQTCQALKV